ncbi:MAG: bifunctional phosphoribosyl-AMP cyclohydrolase/phosphoribosyl-ATP diphosphatase HisIE [Chloroflexi bacterium]|nr:bifunctional phosphoribosyl-AMP cyclohydrolase/phosphoribosyl-ATP diphosphatase HisIE [Chloroflexota bacterium]
MATVLTSNERGLVPAIAQDAKTGQVLMLAYMDAEALRHTLESGQAWFYSRSREELWHKGATSGNILHVRDISVDCDGDALLLRVDPTGPACHTGNTSCFFQALDRADWQIGEPSASVAVLTSLAATIAQRRQEMPEGSYTARLFQEGRERIAQKVIEEAGETALAAVAGAPERLPSEAADLLYHLLVLLEEAGVPLDQVMAELRERRR